MKKKVLILLFMLFFSFNHVEARCHGHYHYYSTPVYLVKSDYFEDEQNFVNCKEHYLLTKTTVNFYSNGTRRTYYSHTVFNNDGSILIADCTDIQHVVYENQHYFLFKKNGQYYIANSSGEVFAKRKYTRMNLIADNRVLVCVNKKYGIIDLQENIVLAIKYKSFDNYGNNIYLTKLNGYYGFVDSNGYIVIRNEYEKIKVLYATFVLKRYGKYGLADINGEIILDAKYDKIKKIGEYILVKKDKLYQVYSSTGDLISDKYYKNIRLERNVLKGKVNGDGFEPIVYL